MKKSFLRILLVLAGFAVLTIPAMAQAPDHQAPDQLLVRVPFTFLAAGHTFPAGEYKITRLRDAEPRILLLINVENRADVVMLRPESQEDTHGKVQLDFATVGHQHVLSRIKTQDYSYSLSVPSAGTLLAAAPSKGAAASSSASGNN